MTKFKFIHSINDLREIALTKFDRCTAVETFWPSHVPYAKFDDDISLLKLNNGKPLDMIKLTIFNKDGKSNLIYLDNDFDVYNDKCGFQNLLRAYLTKEYGQEYEDSLMQHIVFPECEQDF